MLPSPRGASSGQSDDLRPGFVPAAPTCTGPRAAPRIRSRRRRRSSRLGVRRFFYRRPSRLDPALDRGLVALTGPRRGLLPRPPQLAKHAPHVARVVANPRELFDHLRHTRKRPVLGGVARSPRPSKQHLLDPLELLLRKPRLPPGPTCRTQAFSALLIPRLSPPHRRRAAYVQASRHRRLRLASLKQAHRSHAAPLESPKVATCHPLSPRPRG